MTERIPLRLLLVEDSSDDALMLEHALHEAGFDLSMRQVDSEESLRAALDEGGWQAVISDYNLPGFNGKRVLEIVRAWHKDIPFLLMTGTIEDATAVRVMELGANDYLMKDNMARLGPALKRELDEAATRRQGRFTAAQYEAILDFASHAIISIDENFRITLFNHGAEETFGYRAEEMLGHSLHRLLPGGLGARHDAHIAAFAAGEHAQISMNHETRVIHGRHRDGHIFPAEASVTRTSVDGRTAYTAILRDITARLELEGQLKRTNEELEVRVAERTRELAQAKQVAENLAQTKSDFLANMSHEIRTPMNAVLGLAYVLGKMALPAEAVDLVKKIHASGESLLGLINDILDFSKIEAGKIDIEHAPFYLGDVLDNLATIMATSAAGKGLELTIAAPPQTASYLIGDPLRLGQVLINLTSNAIKFTARGHVEVKISVIDDGPHSVRLRFCVTDSGIGMDADTQARLFAPFTQADASTTRRFGGTGLGLIISRRLVELMGGQMALESYPGEGSTFSFTLTLDKQESAQEHMAQLLDLKLLVADDNWVSLEGLGATLRSLGWTPELFENGRALLQRVMEDASLQSPATVLLLDWQMPDLNGTDLARTLQESLPAHQRPIVLIITAQGTAQLQDLPSAGVADAILAKPVGPSMLYNAIMQARNHRLGKGNDTGAPQAEQRLAGIRLLVVDDSEINREVAQRIFAVEGAQVSLVADGQGALDWLAARPDAVDVILMDVHMPIMDGLEATRHIRRMPDCGRLPILALSAGAFKEQRDKAEAAGMDGFIAKPFVVDQAIQQILQHVRPEHPANGADSASFPGTDMDAAQAPPCQLNSDYGEKLFRKRGLYVTYLGKFIEQYRVQLDRIASPDTPASELGQLAHKLRGSAGTLGLERVAAAATRLEARLLHGHEAGDDARQLHDELLRCFEAIGDYRSAFGPAEGLDTAPPMQRLDLEIITPLLQRALAGVREFDPAPVELALAELGHYLDRPQLDRIAAPLLDFRFDQAETALHALATDIGCRLEN